MAKQYTGQWFTMHNDPSHGWLKVSFSDLVEVGLEAAKDFSQFSYWNMQKNYKAFVYLEEDCDAGIFLAAYYGKHRAMPLIKNSYTDGYSKIRGFNPLPRGERFDANLKALAQAAKEMNAA